MEKLKIVHFCAGLEGWNGMANTARQFVAEERTAGQASLVTNRVEEIADGTDVVTIHGAWLPAVHRAAKRAKTIGAKLIIRPAGSYDPVRLRYHRFKKWLVGPWERAMLMRADVILATCPAEAAWVRAYLGTGAETATAMPKIETTDLKRFFKLGGKESVKPGNAVPGDREMRILYLGRRHPLKGVEFLERAVREINTARPQKSEEIALRIVSGHFGDELERDWAWCDALCLPTLSENFGRVVAEALERGKRVITTDGAPAWEPPSKTESASSRQPWWDRVVYLRGFRDGDAATRVRLLVTALQRLRT